MTCRGAERRPMREPADRGPGRKRYVRLRESSAETLSARREVAERGAQGRAAQRGARPSTESLRAPDRRRLYEQLADRLLDYVEVTGLTVGERLPSERDLAEALQVSRASVRQATVALEVRGTLEVRHGDGIYLRSMPDDSGHLMELMTRRHRLPAILEAREALETQLAALAATRRTDGDLAAMTKALDIMAADVADGGLGEEG